MAKPSLVQYIAVVTDCFNIEKGVNCPECKFEDRGICLLTSSEIPIDEEEMRENCPFCKGEVNGRCY